MISPLYKPAPITQRHLSANERDLTRHNMLVRVVTVNKAHTVAFCTVEQRHAGLLRRRVGQRAMLWHAEQALAPLSGLGVTALVTVLPAQHPEPGEAPGLLRRLWNWLGQPLTRSSFGITRATKDPFGWLKARSTSGGM